MDHRRVPLSAKLNILIVVTILAVSVGLMITGDQAYCRKVDDFLYARCEDAAGAASQSGGELAEDLWHAISTEEFRSVRARAIEKNDETIIREWMKAQPRTEPPESEQSEPSLYGEYEDLIRS